MVILLEVTFSSTDIEYIITFLCTVWFCAVLLDFVHVFCLFLACILCAIFKKIELITIVRFLRSLIFIAAATGVVKGHYNTTANSNITLLLVHLTFLL